MQAFEEIEMQLWEYLDDTCSDADKKRIALLIENDRQWQQKYNALAAVHQSLQQMDTAHPAMRFTQNVMENITGVKPARSVAGYINKRVVKGIAAFFFVTTTVFCLYVFTQVSWTSNTGRQPSFNFSSVLNGNVLTIAMFINIILGLLLFDRLARKNKARPGSHIL